MIIIIMCSHCTGSSVVLYGGAVHNTVSKLGETQIVIQSVFRVLVQYIHVYIIIIVL